MRTIYNTHKQNNVDLGMISEIELLEKMWPNLEQPITQKPTLSNNSNAISLSSDTKGSTISYLISDNPNEQFNFDSHWKLYTAPFNLEKGTYVYAIAERIGFAESEIIIVKI